MDFIDEKSQLISKILENQNFFKQKVEKILVSYPRSGLYLKENPNDWKDFIDYLIKVFDKSEGARGEFAFQTRIDLQKKKDLLDPLLKDLGLSTNDHIRVIYEKFKTYSPCKIWNSLNLLKEKLEKQIKVLEALNKSDSQLREKIIEGLKKKKV